VIIILVENLETARLRFRCLTFDDEELLMEFFSNVEALRYFNMEPNNRSYCRDFIARQIERYGEDNGLCAMIDKQSGEQVGQCGLLFQQVDGVTELEIGYRLMPRFWGKGYATEGASACRDLAFSRNLAPSIISIIHIHNTRSQNVAMRNGMKPTVNTKFKSFDVIIYRITSSEWESLRK